LLLPRSRRIRGTSQERISAGRRTCDPHGIPASAEGGGPTAYWGVRDIDAASKRLHELGADDRSPIADVGDGIRVAVLTDPFGNAVGIIENPHFRVENVR